jgi:hypothetical protein
MYRRENSGCGQAIFARKERGPCKSSQEQEKDPRGALETSRSPTTGLEQNLRTRFPEKACGASTSSA